MSTTPDENGTLASWFQTLVSNVSSGESEDLAEIVKKRIHSVAQDLSVTLESPEVPAALDAQLVTESSFQRASFLIPKIGDLPQSDTAMVDSKAESIYMVGNSLGLQPVGVRQHINEHLESWATLGVNGHFCGERPWMPIDENVIEQSARIVGALPSEVAVMNSLTVNLHLLFVSFYRPDGKRNRILYEADSFPSDFFAFESQAKLHGLDPESVLLPIKALPGQELLNTDDIIAAIEKAGDTLAVVCLGTVQYYTGQYFDVPAITKAAQACGAKVIWDCAHAAGNLHLKLHDWGVDGACWCTYKYMNAGPGGIGGFFVHEKHHGKGLPLLAGWWGQRQATRFNMAHSFEPEHGASAWRLSNPPVLQTESLLASLKVFAKTSMAELRARSILLTAYFEILVQHQVLSKGTSLVAIITPADPRRRGCQLSIKFSSSALCEAIFKSLECRGVVVDHRKPNVIRAAPAPLYNTFTDVFRFCQAFAESFRQEQDNA